MPELQPFPLVTRSGKTGRVFRASRFLDRSNVNRVEFDDGTSTTVLATELHVNPDGTFVLDDEPAPAQSPAPPQAPPPQRPGGFMGNAGGGPRDRAPRSERFDRPVEDARPAPPPAAELPDDQEETLAMETAPPEPDGNRPSPPGAAGSERVERAPSDRRIVLDEPVFVEDVDVQRVPVNRLVDRRPETRQEGDTTVIPVVEEVVTIQKRLLVREEVRITRRRTEVREPRRVMLDGEGTQVVGSDGRNIDLK